MSLIGFGGFGMALAPRGPEFTAPLTGAGIWADWLNWSIACWSVGDEAILAPIVFAAWVSAIAPTIAGPRVRPKSRSMLVAPLAMPALDVGTLLTATTVMAVTAVLKPAPTTSSGTAIAAIERLVAGIAARATSPRPISVMPAARTHPGL